MRFLIVLLLGFLSLYQTYAYATKEEEQLLNQLLDKQENPQYKNDKTLQIQIDALVNKIAKTNNTPIASPEEYDTLIGLSNSDNNSILTSALTERKKDLSLPIAVNPVSSCTILRQPLSLTAQNLSQDVSHITQALPATDLEIKEQSVVETFKKSGHQVSSLISIRNHWSRRQYFGPVDHQGQSKKFFRYWNRGDGNCALYGMGKTRTEFVQKVRDQLRIDPGLRNDLREGAYNYCGEGIADDTERWRTCSSILNPTQDQNNMHRFGIYIDHGLRRNDEFLSFGGHASLLAAAARLFGLNVRVWQDNPANPGHIQSTFESINNPSEPHKTINLFYTPGHFDLLLEEGQTQERMNALDRELQFLTTLG